MVEDQESDRVILRMDPGDDRSSDVASELVTTEFLREARIPRQTCTQPNDTTLRIDVDYWATQGARRMPLRARLNYSRAADASLRSDRSDGTVGQTAKPTNKRVGTVIFRCRILCRSDGRFQAWLGGVSGAGARRLSFHRWS